MKGITTVPSLYMYMLTINGDRHFGTRWELPLDLGWIMALYAGGNSCEGFPPFLDMEEP